MEEKRKFPRHRTFLRGKLEFNNRMSSLDCIVRDFSDGGARLELAETYAIPDAFELVVPAKSLRRAACLKWRTSTHAGIIFTQTLGGAEPNDVSIERRLQELEAENAELRRLIADLRAAAAENDRMAV